VRAKVWTKNRLSLFGQPVGNRGITSEEQYRKSDKTISQMPLLGGICVVGGLLPHEPRTLLQKLLPILETWSLPKSIEKENSKPKKCNKGWEIVRRRNRFIT
jgi:hypothetical protein